MTHYNQNLQALNERPEVNHLGPLLLYRVNMISVLRVSIDTHNLAKDLAGHTSLNCMARQDTTALVADLP